eukprot:1161915-Pelagomonas_calceolata.AAC.12
MSTYRQEYCPPCCEPVVPEPSAHAAPSIQENHKLSRQAGLGNDAPEASKAGHHAEQWKRCTGSTNLGRQAGRLALTTMHTMYWQHQPSCAGATGVMQRQHQPRQSLSAICARRQPGCAGARSGM